MLCWDIFGWKWQKSSLKWLKQTNEKEFTGTCNGKAPGPWPRLQLGPGNQMTGRGSHLCLPAFGSVLRQLSPSGDGDARLYLTSLIIPVRRGLLFPCGLIKSPSARLSLAGTWGPVPLSELISGPGECEHFIGQALVMCSLLEPIRTVSST